MFQYEEKKGEYQEKISQMRKSNPFISNTDVAYKMILDAILDGAAESGERLQQDQLAELFDMSKTPVRDALLRLVENGFCTRSAKSGFEVAQVSFQEYMNYCDFRCIIESNAAYYAAINISTSELEQLKRCHERMYEAVSKRSAHLFLELDEEFHGLIVQASHNPFIIETYQDYIGKRKFYTGSNIRGNENHIRFWNKHDDIYQAIAHNREQKAREVMQSHLKSMIYYFNK